MYESMDYARNPGLKLTELEKFLDDMRIQPQWRLEADRACDYYDGHQLSNTTLQAMARLGIPPLITNLIQPTVDLVLGMEAKTRADPRVASDTDDWQEVAEAQSVKLKEAQRESNADTAIADAYASQIKAGLGWVFVGRAFDPFAYQHVVEDVPRNEIWWDWHSKRRDLSDARWLVRRKWYDIDLLLHVFGRHKELIKSMVGRYSKPNWDLETIRDMTYAQTLSQVMNSRIDESEWLDSDRDRLGLYEVWYRHWVRGHVIKLPNGRVIEVDVKNARHAKMILNDMVTPVPAVFPKVRMSWWIGPYRLEDVEIKQRHFPYVPFWGRREDRSNAPYGLIRAMMSPQDEVNARAAKMMWQLSAHRVRASKGAVADPDRARKEISRPDAWIELSEKFDSRKDVFEVDSNFELSEQQFKVMLERKRAINEAAGVFQQMLGDAKGGADSGVAIASLVEQGVTTLAEINDNYRFARRLVYEYLLENVTEDLAGAERVIPIAEPGKPKKTVRLNVPAQDDIGEYLENDVRRALTKVGLEDVPSTPAYRAQMFRLLAEMAKGLPPQLQAFVVPFILRASELPQRHEIADTISQALGMQPGEGPPDPEKEQLAMDNAVLQELVQRFQAAMGEAGGIIEKLKANNDGKERIESRKLDQKDRELALKEAETGQRMTLEGRNADLELAERALAMAQPQPAAK